jgi:hypothetical protein
LPSNNELINPILYINGRVAFWLDKQQDIFLEKKNIGG